jgi:4-amino-4-deoxy-L-arabinose transferase-like glycosyltransferase
MMNTIARGKLLLRPLSLGVIILLAVLLRIDRLDIAEFKYDEANMLARAAVIADQSQLPIEGSIGSTGWPNPPLLVYLYALPVMISRDPALSLGCLAIISTLAVAATYRFGRAFFGQEVGLVAALLLAVNPWAIF